ncbi:hypothetical protein OG21DRAFT_1487391 [Imleria badia]|jgi:hypothetical protein|nr:hypothetical protein OG21DRAFT_1487391 [Imleria badia]
MSYLSGQHLSRGESTQRSNPITLPTHPPTENYYRSANFVSDSERTVEERDVEEDTLLAGDHGGRGIGLAGGYPGSQPSRAMTGAGDDSYAGYDPGMAGCTTEPSTCHIPGLPWMGSPPPESPSHLRAPAHVHTASRGYERDEDEYAESITSETKSSTHRAGGVAESGPGAVPVPVPAAELATETATEPVPAADPATEPPTAEPAPAQEPEPEQPHPPSIGSRLVGRVERLAGKVLRDPDIQARGKLHMVRPQSLGLVSVVLTLRIDSERR